jgi:hypothetical protein
MKLAYFLPLFCLVACVGTSDRLNRLSLGMNKTEVIRAMGPPDSTAAKGETEYLIYHLASPKALIVDDNNIPRYFVRLRNGKVDAYGEKGDFDSSEDPTVNLNIRTK